MEYVLLMRGINVGGKRRVIMADLRTQLTEAGASEVTSYINSGNILFNYEGDAKAMVVQLLASHYDFKINHTVIAAPDYLAEVNAAPEWWQTADDHRYNALFKLPGYRDKYDQLIENKKSTFDEVLCTPHVVFWRSPLKVNYTRSFFSKLLSAPFYAVVSIRNRNTTLKLARLIEERLK
ncbi:hypothetical protein IWT140_01037 [Secundilactobacillus pentosiphilus]|uniref:Phosphopentomutase n=1 Tax=Secundilactobacillus pentosiphilus TaxID=1714682 RepID=A0A1Z5INU4_9LACO|nr:DUF1697 domain-containing protein [Secundilactobacillus pentosiphilus]GAX03434.1 hypothetical protein IWT140_01037 [Secundilactobacillus pentosiphilus]